MEKLSIPIISLTKASRVNVLEKLFFWKDSICFTFKKGSCDNIENELAGDKMKKDVDIQLTAQSSKAVQKGYPLILANAVVTNDLNIMEGTIVRFVDSNRKFLAKGYFGKQNKGIGWVLTRDANESIDGSFFTRKIVEAFKRREHFSNDEETTAYRLFNGEGDGIGGMTIDYYDGYYVVNWYSEGIYHFRQFVYEAIEQLTYKAIYEKKRFNIDGQYIEQDDFVRGTRGDFPIIVKENGMNFAVDLNDGAMTGIFLDQRDVRKRIRDEYAKGKTVLNTFSYTGAFSVAACLGGAIETTSVDLAKRSLPKTIEQFSVNGIDYEQQQIKVIDVFDYFRYAKRHQLTYDIVILDPPSFARSKKMTFSTAKDYPKLLLDALAITESKGIIVASTNNASFGMTKFKGFINTAFQQAGESYRIIEELSLPKDFRYHRDYPEFNYLKVVILQRLN